MDNFSLRITQIPGKLGWAELRIILPCRFSVLSCVVHMSISASFCNFFKFCGEKMWKIVLELQKIVILQTWLPKSPVAGCDVRGLCSRRPRREVRCCCPPPKLLRDVHDWNPDSWPRLLGLVELARGTPRLQDRAKWAAVRWPSGLRIEPRVEALPELLSSEIFLPFKYSFRNGFRKAMLLSNIGNEGQSWPKK